jgi:hypothetical protein
MTVPEMETWNWTPKLPLPVQKSQAVAMLKEEVSR